MHHFTLLSRNFENVKGAALCLLICAALFTFGQTPVQFQHTYGTYHYNYGMDVIQTTDSGYVILSNVSGFSGNTNVFLLKIDQYGTRMWDMIYADTALFHAQKFALAKDGGFIITGYTNKFPEMGYNVFLMKTDAAGHKEWVRYYGGTDWDFGLDVVCDTSGNYYITGNTYSFGAGESDVYVIKTDLNGDTIWTRTFGGIEDDAGNSLTLCENGDIAIAGYTNSLGAGAYDFLLLRFDADGNLLWHRTFGGADDEKAFAIKEIPYDNHFIIGGYSKSFGNGLAYFYFVKASPDGFLNWHDISGWSGGDYGDDIIYALDITSDSGFVFAGTSTWNVYQDIFILKTKFDGEWHFSTSHGGLGTDDANAILQTLDSCYIIVGTSEWFGPNLRNIYVIKTGYNGESSPYNLIETPQPITENAIKLYPNPFSESALLEILNSDETAFLQVYNVLGEKIMEETFSRQLYLKKNTIGNGIYFYQLKIGSAAYYNGSFVVY